MPVRRDSRPTSPSCLGFLCRRLTIAASFNASSPSLAYKVPAKSATITASPQTNSSKYVFGNCTNVPEFIPAYTTVTSLVNTCGFVIITAEAQLSALSTCSVNTTVVSTIAPSTTCCNKCEVGAGMNSLSKISYTDLILSPETCLGTFCSSDVSQSSLVFFKREILTPKSLR